MKRWMGIAALVGLYGVIVNSLTQDLETSVIWSIVLVAMYIVNEVYGDGKGGD